MGETEAARAIAESRYPHAIARLDQYAGLLADLGSKRGLIGPREVPRLWSRHLLNCAAVADLDEALVAEGSTVIDVGSGAGLPGLVWGIVRDDLIVTLVEPMQRRVDFLRLAVEQLGLEHRVFVVRARAEELIGQRAAEIVTARAVAPLPVLAHWLLPLAQPAGAMLALKGASAREEVEGSRREVLAAGAGSVQVVICGRSWLDPPTTVVVVRPESGAGQLKGRKTARGGADRGESDRGRQSERWRG